MQTRCRVQRVAMNATAWRNGRRLSWERPLDPGTLTPASAPQPCGRSPGRPQGRRSGCATRYPALNKAA